VPYRDHPALLSASSSGRRFNRRKFLGGAAAGLGTYAVLGGPAILTSRGAVATGGSFDQSVASGDPSTDAITLWTRVNDISGDRTVRLEVFKNSDGTGGVFDGQVPVLADNPIAKVRLDSLDAGEQYFYRFSTGSAVSPQGRFRTARPADSNEPVKIAFFSCQEFGSGFYHAHRDLADTDDIDLVVCLGDYVYERAFDTAAPPQGRQKQKGEAQTLQQYRETYNFYNSDQDLLAMRAKHPMAAIWDDHEVEDNYAEMLPGGATMDRRIPYRNRMANGYRAFFEYIPIFPVAGNQTRIYRTIRLGNAEIFLLDTRQYRDNQVCSPGDSFAAPNCPPTEYNKPGRTLLGKEQLAWLKSGLESSSATWKIVGNQVMIMSLEVGPRNPLNTDGWDGYGDERRQLIDHIDDKNILNVTFITGDIHTFFAGEVTRSGRRDGTEGTPRPPDTDNGVIVGGVRRATEFVGGSITSKGIADRLSTSDPRPTDAISEGGNFQVRSNNPHIKYSNQSRKGYAIMSTGDKDLRVEYRAVCNVMSQTDKSVVTLARFQVPQGEKAPQVTGGADITPCGPDDRFVPITRLP
jgi:alkaline phosphatase D